MNPLLHLSTILTILSLSPYVIAQSNSNSNTNSVCTGPMMRSFGSCLGYLVTGSNASSPTSACCNSLKDLMSNGQDCLCLIVTGGVPFEVPINRSLAISLPKACRQYGGVPIECKATASPVPAPEPRNSGAGAPNENPGLSPPPVSQVPFIPQPFTPPSTGGGGFAPPSNDRNGGMSPPLGGLVPTLTPPGMRPTLSAAQPSRSALSSLLIATVSGLVLLIIMS